MTGKQRVLYFMHKIYGCVTDTNAAQVQQHTPEMKVSMWFLPLVFAFGFCFVLVLHRLFELH